MEKTITVKGTGRVSIAPDLTVVSLNIHALNKKYAKMMDCAAEKLESLRAALVGIGFSGDDLKTTDFNIYTENESVRDENGNYRSVFAGYACNHGLKVEFASDSDRLAALLSAIAGCVTDPGLSIQFTVRDRDAVRAELLRAAAANAKEKASILADASGVALGELISIDYSWADINVVSPTNYGMDVMLAAKTAPRAVRVTPDNITVSDSASFVWEITPAR